MLKTTTLGQIIASGRTASNKPTILFTSRTWYVLSIRYAFDGCCCYLISWNFNESGNFRVLNWSFCVHWTYGTRNLKVVRANVNEWEWMWELQRKPQKPNYERNFVSNEPSNRNFCCCPKNEVNFSTENLVCLREPENYHPFFLNWYENETSSVLGHRLQQNRSHWPPM